MSIPETTLSTPLLEKAYDGFFRELTAPSRHSKTEIQRAVRDLKNCSDYNPNIPIERHHANDTPRITMGASLSVSFSTERAAQQLNRSLEFLLLYCTSLKQGFSDILGVTSLVALVPRIKEFDRSLEVVQDWARVIPWLNYVEASVEASRKKRWISVQGTLCHRRFCLLLEKDRYTLLTYDALLMFKDMMYSRFIIRLVATLDPERSSLTSLLTSMTLVCDGILNAYGNIGYELIKGIEALCKVRIISLREKYLDHQKQCQNMLDKYRAKEYKLSSGSVSWVDKLWSVICSSSNPSDVAEMFGFMKLYGHPYVDPIQGCAKVKEMVHEHLPIDQSAVKDTERSFCHVYTRGYLARTSRWPPLEFLKTPKGKMTRLEKLYLRNQPVLAVGFTQYDASDWDHVRFKPHQTFSMGEDILSLIVDKSLSYPRSEFDAGWYGKLDYVPPKPSVPTRVLERVITMEKLDMAEIVETVQMRKVPNDWKVVGVSPKEREMKLEPRMFSMMTIEMRSFFVLCESNLKKGVFKYISEQTMTLSRQEQIQRFLSITDSKVGRWVKLKVEIDFSSWNLKWEDRNHGPVALRLDQIYGTPGVYSYIHEFFDECLIYLKHGDYPPTGLCKASRADVMNGHVELETVWTHHKNGFEGIAQGPWTATTIGMVHSALQSIGIPFQIIGQGDNQVCVFEIFVPDDIPDSRLSEYLDSVKEDILTRLSSQADRLGHEIKPEECLYSTCFFSYSKEMYLDGEYLPTLAKYLSRVFPATSSDCPSFCDALSTISSGTTAATEKANVSIPCLHLSKMIEHLTLCRESNRSMLHDEIIGNHISQLAGPSVSVKEGLIDLSVVIPGNLGGLPISSPLEFLYRGHSDPLSSSLASLYLLRQFPGVLAYIRVLEKGWVLKSTPDADGIILDPYAIPLSRPSPPSTALASCTSHALQDIVRNKAFDGILAKSTDTDRKNLFSWISSLRPFYPKVAHDLYKSSLIGMRDTFAKRFTNTRTLSQVARKSGYHLTDIALQRDRTYVKAVFSSLAMISKVSMREPGRYDDPSSSFWFANHLRSFWKLGDSLEGVTNLHPLMAGKLISLPSRRCELTGTNEIIAMVYDSPSEVCSNTRGSVKPYVGSKTSDKSVEKWTRPIDSSPPLMDVLKILAIREMMTIPGTLPYEQVTRLAETRTTIPLSTLVNFLKVKVGGTVAHRYQTRDDPRGSFVNTSMNWPSHITVSTNHAGELGGVDYPFDFTEAVVCLQGTMSWIFTRLFQKPPFGLCLQVDLTRMTPVADHIVQSDKVIDRLPIPVPSYYATVESVTVSRNALSSARFFNQPEAFLPSEGQYRISDALVALLLSHMTGRIKVSSKFSHTLGEISHRRIIDMPEVRHINSSLFLASLATAFWMKISIAAVSLSNRTTRKLPSVMSDLLSTEIRRVVPSLYGTIRELDNGGPVGDLGMGLGAAESVSSLAAWMSRTKTAAIAIGSVKRTVIFMRGGSSVSRSLASALGSAALEMMTSGDKDSWKLSKLLGRLIKLAIEHDDEPTRVRHLMFIARLFRVSNRLVSANTSPEECLRQLRNRTPTSETLPKLPQVRLNQPPLIVPPEGVSISSSLTYSSTEIDPEELVTSWYKRPNDGLDSAYRWAPIQSQVLGLTTRVLLVGVGSGIIGCALPESWRITGVDLGTALAKQGHGMVDYTPPGLKGRFQLHNVSWSMGGDITETGVRDVLLKECRMGYYDLVVIDVDRVSQHQRLQIRREFGSTGVLSFCRVFFNLNEVPIFLASVQAVSNPGSTRLWSCHTYPNREFIVGGFDEPLGLNGTEVGGKSTYEPLVIQPSCCDVTNRSIQEVGKYYFELTGDLPPSDEWYISIADCRTLLSKLPKLYGYETGREIAVELIKNHAPRRRVRAMVELEKIGKFQSPSTLADAPFHSDGE